VVHPLLSKMSTEQVTAQVVNDFKQWMEQHEHSAVAVAAIRALTTVSYGHAEKGSSAHESQFQRYHIFT